MSHMYWIAAIVEGDGAMASEKSRGILQLWAHAPAPSPNAHKMAHKRAPNAKEPVRVLQSGREQLGEIRARLAWSASYERLRCETRSKRDRYLSKREAFAFHRVETRRPRVWAQTRMKREAFAFTGWRNAHKTPRKRAPNATPQRPNAKDRPFLG